MDERETEFLGCLADVLEVDSISGGDDYRASRMWGSMTAFALKITIARKYGKDFSLKELDGFPSAAALMERALA